MMPVFRPQTAPSHRRATRSGGCRRAAGLAVALALALSACAAPPPTGGSARVSRPAGEQGAACMIGLSYSGTAFNRLKDTDSGNACGIGSAVSLVAAQATLSKPAPMDCGLAIRYARFDEQVIQPLAMELFGRPVTTVHHYGSYNCRGRTSDRSRLSEHSYGKALDLGMFELQGGDSISVTRHWRGAGPKSEFLQRVARSACDYFSVVLSPNSDKDHYDHIHVDIGPWKKCGT